MFFVVLRSSLYFDFMFHKGRGRKFKGLPGSCIIEVMSRNKGFSFCKGIEGYNIFFIANTGWGKIFDGSLSAAFLLVCLLVFFFLF